MRCRAEWAMTALMGAGEGTPPEHPWAAIDAGRRALWIDAQGEPE